MYGTYRSGGNEDSPGKDGNIVSPPATTWNCSIVVFGFPIYPLNLIILNDWDRLQV
jgi:hypothetical protein